ncbi:hypothetical protein OHI65_14770 [Brucella sp. MAB-22]|uniref:hypothetical protein n=1 Tax=Brucella sp. MAB-22 TaxID=2986424 RepID=UPI00222125D1|nr:hypothetical protein [Brucella sp. MAB-22]UYT57731.1 hypothetical protein OHI65_14770 [Brucella sp. MAB-22]
MMMPEHTTHEAAHNHPTSLDKPSDDGKRNTLISKAIKAFIPVLQYVQAKYGNDPHLDKLALAACPDLEAAVTGVAALSAVRELHGPFGHIVGRRDLREDEWSLENDPVDEDDAAKGFFSVPLYALTDPFKEIGVDGPANANSPATRELALEEHLQAIEQQLAINLEYFHDEKRFLLETLQAHITTRIAAIRALSSPDHADAGKVEGDGWLPIESAPKDGTEITARRSNRFKAFSCFFCHGEWLHYDHEDGLISYRPTEWKPFPQSSAPASEGAE